MFNYLVHIGHKLVGIYILGYDRIQCRGNLYKQACISCVSTWGHSSSASGGDIEQRDCSVSKAHCSNGNSYMDHNTGKLHSLMHSPVAVHAAPRGVWACKSHSRLLVFFWPLYVNWVFYRDAGGVQRRFLLVRVDYICYSHSKEPGVVWQCFEWSHLRCL